MENAGSVGQTATNQLPTTTVAAGTWAFVTNRLAIKCELPFELADGCVLDKATPDQVDAIRKAFATPTMLAAEVLWEWDYRLDPVNNQLTRAKLPKEEWMYYVVKTCDLGLSNQNLNLASSICETPLDAGTLTFIKMADGNTASGAGPYRIANLFFAPDMNPARIVERQQLEEISAVYGQFMDVTGGVFGEGQFPEIRRAIETFDSLSSLPKFSDFNIIGLFAIIEMLVTHNPKLEDRGDSITHQMQSKIPLLMRRFDRSVNYQQYFSTDSSKKIWSALYKYRSAIAHGGQVVFEKDMQILKSPDCVREFMRDVVKALLRHSLREPQLYADLREC
ncbi:HEPN domain-containing protein [Ralstonia pseudosolanacearum]|uniref:hypothetical protein n=1 Tax=Ralstonia pseudosolanacearum TaxID=1310165 RepID=UPI003C22777A